MAHSQFSGVLEQQSISTGTSQEQMLHVKNLPVELNAEGVRQIFNSYGKILDCFCPNRADWAYITYGSSREAEYAIRSLHDKSPLYLQVSLARKRDRDNTHQAVGVFKELEIDTVTKQIGDQTESILPNCSYNKGPIVHNQEHNHSMPLLGHKSFKPLSSVHQCTSNENLLYSPGMDPSMYNPYETAGPYNNTNIMWMRGNVTVTSDGKRHVTMGRGYTLYELPKSYPKVEEQIGKVFQKRNDGLYEYDEDKLIREIGKCQYCFRPANMNCQRCNSFYCSRSCQVADWQRHKVECQEIPALRKGPDINSLSHSGSDDQLLDQSMSTNQCTLRRPKVPPDTSDIMNSLNPPLATSDKSPRQSQEYINDNTPNAKHKEIIDITKRTMTKNGVDNLGLGNKTSNYLSPKQAVHNRDQIINENQNGVCNKNIEQNQDKQFQQVNFKSNISSTEHDSDNNMQNKGVKFQRKYPNLGDSNSQNRNKTNHDNKPINTKRNLNFQYKNNTGTESSYNNNEIEVNNEHRANAESKGDEIDKSIKFFPNRQQFHSNISKPVTKEKDVKIQSNILESESDIPFQKVTIIPKNKFINVKIIISEGNGIYWIQRQDEQEALQDMMCKLNDPANSLQTKKPVVGNIYAVLYENIWHRAVLKSLNPKKVFYVDFGNVETLQTDDFRSLNDFKDIPYFARKISLAKGTSSKYHNLADYDVLTVKAVNVDSEGTVIVQVEGENIESNPFAPLISIPSNDGKAVNISVEKPVVQTNTKTSLKPPENTDILAKTLPSVIDLLTPNVEGCLEVHTALDTNVVAVTIVFSDIEDILNKVIFELPKACEKIPKASTFSPKIGDLICGQRADGDWLRGYVLSLGPPIRLAVVDESRVEPVFQIAPYPKQFVNIRTVGAVCELLNSNYKPQPKERCTFKVIDLKEIDGRKEIEISVQIENNKSIRALMKHWVPVPEQTGVPFARLNSGSEVCLTSYRNQSFLFARSLEIEKLEEYNRILQDVAKYAQTAQPLTELPVIGQMVIAKYIEDGNYYRAIVVQVEDDKIAVSYVDYGNREITTLKNLRILSDELKQRPSCAAKIILKDVPKDIAMTKEVNDYLTQLVGKEQPLICTFEGIPSKDGVYLKTSSGESVNEKITQLLEPSWKKEGEKDNTCYTADYLEIASLGEVGQTVNVVVLYKLSELVYMMGPQDQDLIVHVTEILPTLINDYCKSTKDHYIPRQDELCLAPYNGVWYRALCLVPNVSPNKSSVLFVDFGNMEDVDNTDIKLIKKDFLTTEALASLCTVTNIYPISDQEQIPAKVAERLSELVTPNQCAKIKITKCLRSGEYEVELPDVRATLIKEGLIKYQ